MSGGQSTGKSVLLGQVTNYFSLEFKKASWQKKLPSFLSFIEMCKSEGGVGGHGGRDAAFGASLGETASGADLGGSSKHSKCAKVKDTVLNNLVPVLQKSVAKYLLVLSILVLPFINKMLELSIGPGGSEKQKKFLYIMLSFNFS